MLLYLVPWLLLIVLELIVYMSSGNTRNASHATQVRTESLHDRCKRVRQMEHRANDRDGSRAASEPYLFRLLCLADIDVPVSAPSPPEPRK